ncbi:MAG: hypothetical protein GKR89_09935 [Candidatus Latescibacteria bacterium]|nr:hypothetical protein [Candidatus Latescibacterota bacterium]
MQYLRMFIVTSVVLVAFDQSAAGPLNMPGLRVVPIPAQDTQERAHRARQQPTTPDGYSEVPFIETAPAPVLRAQEQERGYLLFSRPMVEPVHPNTLPLEHERLTGLVAFATPGEFEPLTFSIYPVRDLRNLRVQVSPLVSGRDEIPATALTTRLATYWNVGYPRYTSRETYRRVPELLERVSEHSSPAYECLRWWVTIHVPADAKPGLYRGSVTIWDDDSDHAVQIPIALRVLSYRLTADPAKHYSAYYYLRNRTQFADRDEAFTRQALANEAQAMADLGLDMLPTMYLRYDQQQGRITLHGAEDLDRLVAAGLSGPLPVAGGNAIEGIYRETTPGAQRASHWKIDRLPSAEFYQKVTETFEGLERERRERGWPELICCPLDEVDASRADFGARVYKAVRDGGIRTYITKNPLAADAAAYGPGVDIWCSQPYSMPYDKIIAQDRFEYWSYPNHNAGEIKDRRVMSYGGRMTYGFGFWRSGYTTLIPWHWAWTPGEDQFDYLRGSRSGNGQRIGDDGEVIPAVYWAAFREGRDDAHYLYTLQQAAWEREGTTNVEGQRLVAAARSLLQRTWDDIHVQQKYLADDMWPAAEFNARRWEMTLLTEALMRVPPVRTGVAPSVLVDETESRKTTTELAFIDAAIKDGQVEVTDLGGDFSEWVNVTGEGAITLTPEAGRHGTTGLRWRVQVDHATDGGGEMGDYPVGWPRIHRTFDPEELDMRRADYLSFRLRVDSDRDENADDHTPVGFTINSNRFYEVGRDLGGQQREWRSVLFPVTSMMETVGQGEDSWASIEKVQLFISESNYTDGTELVFDVAEVKVLRFRQPMLRRLEVPQHVLLPRARLAIGFEVLGMRDVRVGTHLVEATLVDERGELRQVTQSDLADASQLVMDTAYLTPGGYVLNVSVRTAQGELCSELEQQLVCHPGPIFEISTR